MLAQLKGMVGETLDRARERLATIRGLFVKNPVRQIGRILSVLRHFEDYREIDRALFYHRWASNLLVAWELGVFDALLEGPTTADELAADCDIESQAARNLLSILASQQLVERDGERFEASPFVREFFDTRTDVSLAPMLELGVSYAGSFTEMCRGARCGETPSMLDVYDQDGRVDAIVDGVNAYLDQAGRELVAKVDWPEIRHLIVGSMGVSFSSLILEQFPDARVTYGCLPHLTERIPRLRRTFDVPPERVVETHAHGGEPFEDQWGREAFDLVFLTKKMILDPDNDLGDKFARKTFEVLKPGGIAVFWETIREDDEPMAVDRGINAFMDFGVSPTGPILTRRRFRRTLSEIGYRDIEVVPCMDGEATFVVARV